jgi:hypothetical protein
MIRVMSGFRDVEAQDYTLTSEDTRSLTYLSATNAGWLPVLSSGRLQFTAYCAHRVRRQFGFDQEVPAVMGVAAGEIPTINPFLKARAFAYWSSVTPQVVIPSGDRVGIYTTGMSNYWRELMAAMVEFRNNGKGDISHLLQVCISPLPHPRLFLATNTMTTYANRQSLGYAVWRQEELRWMTFGDHHPPLWLSEHPNVPAPRKVASSRGRRIVPIGTPTAKKGKSGRSKKREAPSSDSPAKASKKKKTIAATAGGSRGVVIQEAAVQGPFLVEESASQGVSAPVSKRPVRKTRAGKENLYCPTFFKSASICCCAQISSRHCLLREKSKCLYVCSFIYQLTCLSHGIDMVFVSWQSKQRADTLHRVPLVIPVCI